MTARALSLLLLFCGCGTSSLPPPKILSVSPSEMVACEGALISVAVDAVLPTQVDYGRSSVSADTNLSLRIGTLQVGSGQFVPGGVLTAAVPPMTPGKYDVALRLADDRPEAILPGGFTVKPNLYPTSYRFDFIADQKRNVPFSITIRAEGPNPAAFNCTAALSSNRGNISPSFTAPFQRGVRVEQVTIDSVALAVVISVADDAGHTGSSNPFRVSP